MESDKHLIIQGILSWANAMTPRETSQISFGLLQVVGSNPDAPTKYAFDLSHLLECSSDAVLPLGSMLLQLCQRHDGGAKFAAVRNLSKCLSLDQCCHELLGLSWCHAPRELSRRDERRV